MQGSPRQGAEHLAAVLQNLLEPFNTYKEREKEGRRAHWDTVLLKGQTEGLIRHQLRKCTHHTEALSPHMSIEEHVPHSPSCRASVLCSRNTKTDKRGILREPECQERDIPSTATASFPGLPNNSCSVQLSLELSRQPLLSQCCVHQRVPEITSSSLHVSL